MNIKFPSIFPVTCHTEHVGPGSTFVAIPGEKQHGQLFIEEALIKGATTIVVDPTFTKSKIPGIHYLHVDNAHEALGTLTAKALENPAQHLTIIGITGTKGKTTTASLLFHFLQSTGHNTALISSVENKIGTHWSQKSSQTTPTADYLQVFFAEAVKAKVRYLVLETSSHALFLKKLHPITLDMALWTNFDQDHLDFHKTMEQYFQAKASIFLSLKPYGKAFINANDPAREKIILYIKKERPDVKIIEIGTRSTATKQYHITKLSSHYLHLTLNKKRLKSSLIGNFNAQNIAFAFSAAEHYTIPTKKLQKALVSFQGVAGRTERIPSANGTIIVDHAHNPSSMNAVLQMLAQQTNQLIVLFGCGGNRDKLKRPIMGQIATKWGTHIIITNDNPRSEDPLSIIQDILDGIQNRDAKKIFIEPDRKKAIALGLSLLKKNGILALLGKGNETEQIIGTSKIPFHDATIARELSQLT